MDDLGRKNLAYFVGYINKELGINESAVLVMTIWNIWVANWQGILSMVKNAEYK